MEIKSLPAFVKYNRDKLRLTQDELAEKAGVGIHFIRNLEQGKSSLRIDKVDKILSLFGYRMAPVVESVDAYQIWFTYKDKPVAIILKDRRSVSGFLIGEIRDETGGIAAWKIVPFPNLLAWQRKKDEALLEIVRQTDIDDIELLTHEQSRKSYIKG